VKAHRGKRKGWLLDMTQLTEHCCARTSDCVWIDDDDDNEVEQSAMVGWQVEARV
jgi:hypothetical protein